MNAAGERQRGVFSFFLSLGGAGVSRVSHHLDVFTAYHRVWSYRSLRVDASNSSSSLDDRQAPVMSNQERRNPDPIASSPEINYCCATLFSMSLVPEFDSVSTPFLFSCSMDTLLAPSLDHHRACSQPRAVAISCLRTILVDIAEVREEQRLRLEPLTARAFTSTCVCDLIWLLCLCDDFVIRI